VCVCVCVDDTPPMFCRPPADDLSAALSDRAPDIDFPLVPSIMSGSPTDAVVVYVVSVRSSPLSSAADLVYHPTLPKSAHGTCLPTGLLWEGMSALSLASAPQGGLGR
jgi:hypothetical protein